MTDTGSTEHAEQTLPPQPAGPEAQAAPKATQPSVAVVIVHGIRTDCSGYSNGLQAKILNRLPPKLRKHVEFQEVFWANCIRPQQNQVVSLDVV